MSNKTRYIWLRFVSAAIDLSFIYCISIIFQFFIWKFTFCRLCDIFVCVFVIYYLASYISLKGITPAKLLTCLKVVNSYGGDLNLKNILLREIVLKMFIGILIPAYILQKLFPIWSPLITLSLELVILIISFILLLIFRKCWWEKFSKATTIKSNPALRKIKIYTFLGFTLIATFALIIIIRPVYNNKENFITTFYPEYPVTHETLKAADFIKNKTTTSTDYVFDLFKQYDIVVLSERYHPEYTQYELISKIITDDRFVKNVGNIFTEIGSVSFQDTLKTYLHTSFINQTELNKSTAILQRNSDAIWPIWDCTNHFDLLETANKLNSSLADSNKINWYFSDLPVNWKTMTHENYLKGFTPFKRDSIMAINIIENYKNIISRQKRQKALVIMNTSHGYALLNQKLRTGIQWLDGSTTNYLIKALPGKVANVMINTTSGLFTPIQYGKWETSFKIAGNPNVGFNFKGSPFANDTWDAFFLNSKSLSYKDIFTGFIFYTPLNEQVKKTGYPYELDNFEDTLLKRAACVNDDQVKIAQKLIANYRKDPNSIMETVPAPYAILLNGINIILFPLLIVLSYLLGLIFLLKKVSK
ncbi:MAG TPA: RDD family protein [Panacibacter sp.]|nr:RDD family protein [Panacibacter sp.]HNP46926.1 RDD family protein [Panacibacter sp.]